MSDRAAAALIPYTPALEALEEYFTRALPDVKFTDELGLGIIGALQQLPVGPRMVAMHMRRFAMIHLDATGRELDLWTER